MPITLRIPKLGVSMTQGSIVEWLAADGDVVGAGQEIYRLETDKTETVIEAPSGGVLRIEADAGEQLDVGTPVGQIQ